MIFSVTSFPAFEKNNSLSEFRVWAPPRLFIYGIQCVVVNIWYYLGFYGSRNVCSTSPITVHFGFALHGSLRMPKYR